MPAITTKGRPAKFPGRCTSCNQWITAGTSVDWTKGEGIAHADKCPAPKPRKSRAKVKSEPTPTLDPRLRNGDDYPQIDLASLDHREHEEFFGIVDFPEWQRCQHGKQLVTVRSHWLDSAPFTVTTGRRNSTQWFTRTVHADGSPCDTPYGDCYGIHSRCRKCEAIDSYTVEQLPYGNQTTCTNCGDSSYYSIGD